MSTFAGFRKFEVHDEDLDITFPMLVLYPTSTPSKPAAFGPFTLDVSIDAPIADGTFPLVAISHGSGGSNMAYRTIAIHLAQNGFVVGLPEHLFNNRLNNDWQYTLENLINRPRHLHLAINTILSNNNFKEHVDADNVAIIGHSVGGYTALAVAGGTPHTQFLFDYCNNSEIADKPYWCDILLRNNLKPQSIDVTADGRVKALVLLAPDVSLFMCDGALNRVNIPILLLVAEMDFGPHETIEVLLQGLPHPSLLTHRMVKNAGHYAFLSPFPDAIKSRVGDAAKDPDGFDRKKFHQELNMEILEFLNRVLDK